mgnify:CR=1 FL=1|tara:strand:+ start:291 stop:770 length:480 start_codon:yes stop_codon:yes gene_type:complete
MLCYIYKISSSKSDLVYIGSTNNKYRFSEHTSRYKLGLNNCSVVKLFDLGLEFCQYDILETFDFIDYEYQLNKEQDYQNIYKDKLVNIISAKCRMTGYEIYLKYKDAKQKYQIANKDKIALQEKARSLIYIDCSVCNKKIKQRNKGRHEKGKKHLANLP